MMFLVVDDDPITLRSLGRILPGSCVMATDGEAAVQAATELRPRLILLDVRLGEENGLEIADRLRVASPDSIIVVFTGMILDDLELQKKGYYYIHKARASILPKLIARLLFAPGSPPGELH